MSRNKNQINIRMRIALHLWNTDESFADHPYGPPTATLLDKLAMALWTSGIRLRRRNGSKNSIRQPLTT